MKLCSEVNNYKNSRNGEVCTVNSATVYFYYVPFSQKKIHHFPKKQTVPFKVRAKIYICVQVHYNLG
jgi:hypothetical protein